MAFTIQADPGDLIPIIATIKDGEGALVDPPLVKAYVKTAVRAVFTYTYGVDDELTRVSLGVYKLKIAVPYAIWTVGQWFASIQALEDVDTSLELEPAVITVNNPRTF